MVTNARKLCVDSEDNIVKELIVFEAGEYTKGCGQKGGTAKFCCKEVEEEKGLPEAKVVSAPTWSALSRRFISGSVTEM